MDVATPTNNKNITVEPSFNVLDVRDVILERGYGDALLQITPEQIFDSRLPDLWRAAQKAIRDIEVYIDNEHFRMYRDPC